VSSSFGVPGGGDIVTRNMPGHGCVFIIDLPLASEGEPNLPALAH
jgi:signal transduction histidine kinase